MQRVFVTGSVRGTRLWGWRRSYHTRMCYGHRWKSPSEYKVPEEWLRARAAAPNLWRLVSAYREHGHKKADLDPLRQNPRPMPPELTLAHYGLEGERNRIFPTMGILSGLSGKEAALSEIVEHLEALYCSTLALEVGQITSSEEREWLTQHYEELRSTQLSNEKKKTIGERLVRSDTLDKFLAKKFPTFKRYSAEGAESVLTFFEEVFEGASGGGVNDVILGQQHRGRLNILTGLLQFPLTGLFSKIMGKSEHAEGAPSSGDVPSHLVSSVDLEMPGGRSLHVTLLPNPSHLESAVPIAMGKTRGRQLSQRGGAYNSFPHGPYGLQGTENGQPRDEVLCLQVHGDASFSAQGVVMECFAMASTPHFDVGGSVHLVVNNQIGFTTEADHGRSSLYCTDVGKMNGAPILHVNGDYPEDVARAARVAVDYWLKFGKDIIVDMSCYRRWGHNELDNPSLTQPLMYLNISERTSVPGLYSQDLETSGVASSDELREVRESYSAELNRNFKEAGNYVQPPTHLLSHWNGMESAPDHMTVWDTGCPVDLLKYIGAKSVEVPVEFEVNPRLKQYHMEERLKKMGAGTSIDWATAEALAFGSLLHQGFNVRLSGQDVGRGTFSHRHAMIVCQKSEEVHVPLNHLAEDQTAFLEVANSPLSEEAVLGFEYGFSIESPRHLVVWEAQFGDFFNGAQVMIDTCVSSGEAKWLLQSGLVMLLPHGYDGVGPEHSSCRLERYLQLCDSKQEGVDGDSVNMSVVHPTTPAQYYHLLRRQMVRNFRKPLIVASPKLILRLPAAVSSLQDMGPGTTFKPVLGDPAANPDEVTRVVLCSGKHYYTLAEHRRKAGIRDTAIIRVELLCPFPSGYIYEELQRYPRAREFIWSQEEPQNMGAWSFVEPRFRKQLNCNMHFVGRKPYAAPATGVGVVHKLECDKLLADTFPRAG